MDYVVMMDFCELWFVMMVLCLWMYICISVAVRFEFELLFFLLENPLLGRFLIEPPLQIHTAGAAGDTAALT